MYDLEIQSQRTIKEMLDFSRNAKNTGKLRNVLLLARHEAQLMQCSPSTCRVSRVAAEEAKKTIHSYEMLRLGRYRHLPPRQTT